ncbi:MAG: hypothetical protein IT383_28740 [Deltaproteobacteria bacterium]|nr:hypothetical protein [Deltaproteobacteria bacterium]
MRAARLAFACAALVAVSVACPRTPAQESAAPPVLPGPEACAAARAQLEQHLGAAPRACRADDECRAQYVRADPCAPPLASSSSWSPDNDAALQELQRAVRATCPADPACAPVLVTPACRLGTCVDTPAPSGAARAFCDAAEGRSWSLTLTYGQEARCDESAYPRVSATVFSELDPALRYVLDLEHPRVGVLLRCLTPDRCEAGAGAVRVVGLRADGFVVELEGRFGADTVRESFLARRCPDEAQCG